MILEETFSLLKKKYADNLDNINLEKVVFGLHLTAVKLNNGLIGFASTLPPTDQEVHCRKDKRYLGPFSPLQFKGHPIIELFNLPGEKNLIISLKTAVINALSAPFLENNHYTLLKGTDPLDLIDNKWLANKKVVLIGAFHSYIEKFVAVGCNLKVLEFNENALQGYEKQYFAPATDYPALLPEADCVVITGMTLVNRSFINIASVLSTKSLNMVIGPSSSFLPEALFSRNIHLMGGTKLSRPELIFQLVAEGGAGYHLFKYCAEKITLVQHRNDSRLILPEL